MRRWKTAAVRVLCGYCGGEIQKADVYMAIIFPAVKREKRRCRECAGELPRDVDAQIEQTAMLIPRPLALLSHKFIATHQRDGKQAACGPEREPGEEG